MTPARTCLGCRQRSDRSLLVRVVEASGKAVVDRSASLPGRGAWVHPTSECVETSLKRKAFGRALRADGALDVSSLAEAIAAVRPPTPPVGTVTYGSSKNRLNGIVTN
jgi:predicted RNA-binding protein YlxR (DUF448 family)